MNEHTHRIAFRRPLCVVVERSRKRPAQLLQVVKGSTFRVRVAPYHKGQREVADLYFDNGSVAREVAFAFFHFMEDDQDEAA
jgi:hypothetical protein